ncbi:hypothetical protein M9Y10_015325 [Tritrichomonas musculus]|uniref:Surface antigen BspA-like protein n=1 Tax=Tritrichomonas musculus TaxID=1915356 RepID=A0ABR2L236_9EUKA
MININLNGSKYLINEEDKTAGIAMYLVSCGEIVIPSFIEYQNCEYKVTFIAKNAFANSYKVKSIEFPANSQVQSIEENAFYESSIERIAIPASVIELKEGWCNGTENLTEIEINENNPRYSLYEDNFIIGKSSIENENYDELVFAQRSVKNVTIPSFIKRICPYAFERCNDLVTVEFPPNSELFLIDKYAFSYSRINEFKVPPTVTHIGENALSFCLKLERVEIQSNSQLQSIEKDMFTSSSIGAFSIPASVIELKEGWCNGTEKLTRIEIDENNPRYSLYEDKFIIGKSSIENENYDELVFAQRSVNNVTIPSFIKRICPHAFERCANIDTIEFPMDSELQAIEGYSFAYSSVKSLKIPSGLKRIGFHSFSGCKKLQTVEFLRNSELQVIERFAFAWSSIESISIPSNLTRICDHAFSGCEKFHSLEIPNDSRLETIENCAFSYTMIESLTIPSNLIELKDEWCHGLNNVNKIFIMPNNPRYMCIDDKIIVGKSSLEKSNYDELVFARRNIKKVVIPSFIERISPYAFYCCKQLCHVEIPTNSKLQSIGALAFSFSSVKKIIVPSRVSKIEKSAFSNCRMMESICIQSGIKEIGESAFASCKKLRRFDIPSNSEIQTINKELFSGSAIESIVIPPSVKEIGENAFLFCVKLKIIEIDENSNLTGNFFAEYKRAIIMIPYKKKDDFITLKASE